MVRIHFHIVSVGLVLFRQEIQAEGRSGIYIGLWTWTRVRDVAYILSYPLSGAHPEKVKTHMPLPTKAVALVCPNAVPV